MQSPEDDPIVVYACQLLLATSENDKNVQLIINDVR